jgi:hypothetical protein
MNMSKSELLLMFINSAFFDTFYDFKKILGYTSTFFKL